MNRTALRSLSLLATLAAIVGCQSAPRLAWWKQDKVAENSAVAATSKTPALPSAQSSPSPVAIAGVTPGTSAASHGRGRCNSSHRGDCLYVASREPAERPAICINSGRRVGSVDGITATDRKLACG